jgi:hypothetical protein
MRISIITTKVHKEAKLGDRNCQLDSAVTYASCDCTEETLRLCLINACDTSHALMDLRFKHFGTFAVIVGLLAASFGIEGLVDARNVVAGFAVVLTILFWLLDYRTNQLFKESMEAVKHFEALLKVPQCKHVSRKVILGASKVTNLIFLSILIAWLLLVVYLLFFRCPSPNKHLDLTVSSIIKQSSLDPLLKRDTLNIKVLIDNSR